LDKPKPLSEEELESIARAAVKDAVDFFESEIVDDRVRAQRYFKGETDIGHEEGRSSVVATKVRDTIRAIKPSLMRVFMSAENPVEYDPVGPEDAPFAEAATRYATHIFHKSGGYPLLRDVFDDALLKKQGIVKVYREEWQEAQVYTFTGLSAEEAMAIEMDEGVTVLERTEAQTVDSMGMPAVSIDMRVSRALPKGRICMTAIPPEDFFIDRGARSVGDCYVCGHTTETRVGDLVADGFSFEEVCDLGTMDAARGEEEDEERRGYSVDDAEEENAVDPSMKLVAVTEAYMRADLDGTGVPVLYKLILGGANYKLLRYEPADEIPFAVFEIDPVPHSAIGTSIYDLTHNDQDAATMMLRGVLDNVALVNTPRTEVVEGQANMGDLLNNEIGGVVRVRAPGMIRDLSVPFVAGQTLPALQYLDQMVEQKTGVTRASMGLDPDALQSTTRAAVTATVTAAAAQVEAMARNLAEGGMRRLFKLLLKLIVKHATGNEFMRVAGQMVQVDPRVWNVDMDVTVNVGLGTGQEDQKLAALREHSQFQQAVVQLYGPDNGLVTLTDIRNTRAEILALSGVRNVDRHIRPMDPQREMQILQAKAQQAAQAAQAQQGMDPSGGLVAAEQIKAGVKLQEMSGRQQVDLYKAQLQDDRERDRMAQDLYVKQAQIAADTGARLDVERIKAAQAMPRGPGGAPQ